MVNVELDRSWLTELNSQLTLRDCMEKIENNTKGALLLVEPVSEKLFGILTDGDIRRALLGGATLYDLAENFACKTFTFVEDNVSRERILKLFDQGYNFVPMLTENGSLVRVLTPDLINYQEMPDLIACAKAPARVSFGGGGTDLTDFFMEHTGAVFNATVAIYSHCTLKKRLDDRIKINSHDFDRIVECDSLSDLVYNKELDLIKAIVKFLKPDFGFELEISSDFPPGSGLGGSSVVSAAVIACFNEFRDDPLSRNMKWLNSHFMPSA
jgi:D-glycero-alpha-D-manno-heptose-7-phosphate kinase